MQDPVTEAVGRALFLSVHDPIPNPSLTAITSITKQLEMNLIIAHVPNYLYLYLYIIYR